MKTKHTHVIVYDGTSYYVVPVDEAKRIIKKDKSCEIIKQGSDFDFLNKVADKLNEFS